MLLPRRQPDKPAAATNKLCSIRTRNGVYTEFGIDPRDILIEFPKSPMAAAAQFRDGVAECPRRCGFASEIYNDVFPQNYTGRHRFRLLDKVSVLILLKNIFLLVSSFYIPLLEYPASRLLGSHNGRIIFQHLLHYEQLRALTLSYKLYFI